MTVKTCIITGANAGIGKQAAIQIANEGYHVIMACRNEKRGEAAFFFFFFFFFLWQER